MKGRLSSFLAKRLGAVFHCALALAICSAGALADEPDFERDIAPIIAKRCLECHDADKASGGLNLTNHEGILLGGESGAALVPGKPQESYLIERVAAGEMPPESRGVAQPIPGEEIALLEAWIAAGANWPADRTLNIYERTTDVRGGRDWWSLQPVVRPEVPRVSDQARVANPIDAFIVARLEQKNIEPAPPADRRTLVRRAYFDLLGLPPSPEQATAFVNDDADYAYERLVDELLASPQYGERWARYWLDLVRFAETCGYERDQLKPSIWRYRDWVINALNSDMPYDKFVTDQLAGDEIPSPDEQSVIATGMLRAGTWNDEPNDPADYVYTRLEDMVHTTTSAFLGLTVKCARCHDHKFDPIRQVDYYRTASFFWAGYIGQENLGGPSTEELGFDVHGWTDKGPAADPIRLLIKGERNKPGEIVEPASLSSIPSLEREFSPPPQGSPTSHRRLQFARWITDPQHPLTARVMVNRLWLHHLGAGIVRTPNNFGFKGHLPTHPQLLDWLAAEFVDGGWKIKRMHKLIMMSATYRQASAHPDHDALAERDFLNRFWWRANRRRLDAEALRDAMLAVSGELNPQMGGPSFFPRMSREALEGLSRKESAWGNSTAADRSRRSVYMMTKRSRLLPLMTTFDFCDTTMPCGQRDSTIVATQALALLNNHFVHGQSEALAGRLIEDAGDDPARRIERAWQLALGRSPDADEVTVAEAHLASQLARFRAVLAELEAGVDAQPVPMNVKEGLSVWLRADSGVLTDDQGRVMLWRDMFPEPKSGELPHDASQSRESHRPQLIADAIGGQPAVRFQRGQEYLHVAGQVIQGQQFSIIAVVSDQAAGSGHRDIISNWRARDRTTNSIFLGNTGASTVRFTDGFGQAGNIVRPESPFVLTAISGREQAATYQNNTLLATSGTLSERNAAAPYVIGVQGNYGAEWWHGDIAEILIYNRAIEAGDRELLWQYLAGRYGIEVPMPAPDPRQLALASLCHVLLNTNEFAYVD